jgi:hypothetical protein
MGSRDRGNSLKYSVWKSTARSLGEDAARARPEVLKRGLSPELVRFDTIDAVAIDAYGEWPSPVAGYPWESVHDWKQDDVKGLDLSLWYDAQLCGMCYATPRGSRLTITIILLERSAGPGNPLQGLVMAMMVFTIITYAEIIKCLEIEVEKPDPGAVKHYRDQGFEFKGTGKQARLVLEV